MDSIDFDNYENSLLMDGLSKSYIRYIFKLISNSEILDIEFVLGYFLEDLICFYLKNKKILENYSPEQSARHFFSQFLQYLFCNLVNHVGQVYAKQSAFLIVTKYSDHFFYKIKLADENLVTLWVAPNTKNTALIEACEKVDLKGTIKVLELLIAAFEVNKKERFNESELEDYLLQENHAGFSALTVAWSKSRSFIVDCLLNLGKRINKHPRLFQGFLFQLDKEGKTALMRAIENDNKDLLRSVVEGTGLVYKSKLTVRTLLAYQDKEGSTALIKSAKKNNVDFLRTLFDYAVMAFRGDENLGFKLFILRADRKGLTPLLAASRQGNREAIAMIFSFAKKTDPIMLSLLHSLIMHQDQPEYSALMYACEAGHVDCVEYLLNILLYLQVCMPSTKGMLLQGLNLRNEEGDSVFELAEKKGYVEIVEALTKVFNVASLENRGSLLKLLLTRIYQKDHTPSDTDIFSDWEFIRNLDRMDGDKRRDSDPWFFSQDYPSSSESSGMRRRCSY
ncbi:MAG: ankyrin repeat domain-containing protein [Pseudomonadota bacterium]